jgi:hypothetical protein
MELISDKNKREFGDNYIKVLIKVIKAAGKDSSGQLIRSIDYRLKDTAKDIEYAISSEEYLNVIDAGRRKKGTYPNIRAISKWARIKGISQDAVFPIARKIFKFGIEPTDIYNKTEKLVFGGKAFNNLEDNMVDTIEEGIINKLNEINK